MTSPAENVLQTALSELDNAKTYYECESFRAFPAGYIVLSKKSRDVLVAALTGRLVDDQHHCAKCGIRWTGVAGAVYCGDCHRAALTGRPPKMPQRPDHVGQLSGWSDPRTNPGIVIGVEQAKKAIARAEAGRPDAEAAATFAAWLDEQYTHALNVAACDERNRSPAYTISSARLAMINEVLQAWKRTQPPAGGTMSNQKRDYDSTVARIAANLLSNYSKEFDSTDDRLRRAAARAVKLARLIVEETKRTQPSPQEPTGG